jgi:hypothetical protein
MPSQTLRYYGHYADYQNPTYCAAPLDVNDADATITTGAFGETGGRVFRVGQDMYFVPMQQVAGDDEVYIACDAQKIEGPVEGWRSRLNLGDAAESDVEDAILDHLISKKSSTKKGEAFVIMRDGKTFRL